MTVKEPHREDTSDRIGLEAADWALRHLDPRRGLARNDLDGENGGPTFLEWCSHSPRHIAIFLNTYETYRRLLQIDPVRRIDVPALVRQAAMQASPALQGTAIDSRGSSNAHFEPRKFSTKAVRWAAAAVVAIVLFLANAQWPFLPAHSKTSMSFSTGVGERHMITLEDGSELTLNTASHVEIMFDRATRRVRLVSGQIFIDVHHEAARRFIVQSGDVTLQDVGTQFDVYHDVNRTRVSVIEGHLYLSCPCRELKEPIGVSEHRATVAPGAGSVNVSLGRGEQVNITGERGTPTLVRRRPTADELKRAIAWTDGHLSFSGESLSEVVQEFNRYNARQFVIADPSIANHLIAGYFPVADPDKLIESLSAQGIAVSVDPNDPTTLRLRRAE